jgi:hypothetical protein
VMDEDVLRKFLEERCPGANFRDGDIRALNSYLTSYGQNVQFWTFWTLLF